MDLTATTLRLARALLGPLAPPLQITRLARVIGAAAGSSGVAAWMAVGAAAGLLPWPVAAAAATTMAALAVAFAVLVRSGLNERLPDPSLTLEMVLAASLTILATAHASPPTARLVIVPCVTMVFAFAAFRYGTRPLLLAALGVTAVAAVEGWWYGRSHPEVATTAAWQALAVGGMLMSIALIGGRVNTLRQRTHRERAIAEATLGSMTDPVITTDPLGRVSSMNSPAEQLCGIPAARAAGMPLGRVLRLAERDARAAPAQAAERPAERMTGQATEPATGQATQPTAGQAMVQPMGQPAEQAIERVIARADRSTLRLTIERDAAPPFEADCAVSPLRSPAGRDLGRVLVLRDVAATRRLMRLLAHEATHDALTGLLNRRGLMERLDALGRQPGEAACLCVIDLDRFKLVNDSCGHRAGDALLRLVADAVRASVRGSDLAARLGGDEFGLVLRGASTAAGERVARTVLQALERLHFSWDGRRFAVGASIGVCALEEAGSRDVDRALERADAACYLAKELGRGRVQVFRDGDDGPASRQPDIGWAARIGAALAEGRFELHAQRIDAVDGLADGQGCYELLLRLRDESGRLVAPGAFLPVAERLGLMPAIDRWVVNAAVDALGRGAREGRALPRLCVNVSAATLREDGFADFVVGALRTAELPGGSLCFELTEAAVESAFAQAARFAERVREAGCGLALDEVGAGLRAIEQLRRLRFDLLKIDGACIRGLESDPVDRVLLAAVVRAARELGAQAVAQHVESEALATAAAAAGIAAVQGFALHRPEPLEQVIGSLSRSSEAARPARPR